VTYGVPVDHRRTIGIGGNDVLAYDYPLLGLFWTMLWFFLWIAWLVALFHIIADIFRSDDMGGFAKALWLIFVLVAPFLGAVVYVIARGPGMGERAVERAQRQRAQFDGYVRDAAGSASSPADQLGKLADLKASGAITDSEFEAAKAKLLA
jgi:hypothetical protein